MSRIRKVKKALGQAYVFSQEVTAREILLLMEQKQNAEPVVATLTAGVVRLDAVILSTPEGNALNYILMVQDSRENPEWVCYEDIPGGNTLGGGTLEGEMFRILDEAVERNGLSYTEILFPTIPGKPLPEGEKEGVTEG